MTGTVLADLPPTAGELQPHRPPVHPAPHPPVP